MRVVLVSALVMSLSLAGCLSGDGAGFAGLFQGEDPDQDTMSLLQDLSEFPEWRIQVDGREDIRTLLYTTWLPITTAHIIQITERDFYDLTTMHRVVDDFVIQGGDPTGTGEGGSGPQGTSDDIPLEIYPGLDFGSGSIGLARWTNDTGDSQYFITEKPQLHLSRPERSQSGAAFGAYSLFAQVFEGQDVVRALAMVETDANDKPVEDIIVFDIEVLAPPKDADLLNVIPDVHPDVSTQGYDGVLETSRILVTDHETVIRFTTDTPQEDDPASGLPVDDPRENSTVENATQDLPDEGDEEEPFVADCTIRDFVLQHPDGMREVLDWHQNPIDPCTFEHAITFDAPGEYIIDLGVDEVTVTVLPWHDDYAQFTGAQASE